MKKILVLTLALAILLAGCGPSDADCDDAWEQLDVPYGEESFYADLVLNREWAPNSIGFTLKECIQSGWDGYQ